MGDEALSRSAFEALYLELEKPVFNVVYRWVWNAEEARDVMHEAFLKVWAARARVRVETVRPLVFKSALNVAANRLRVRRLRRFLRFDSAEQLSDGRGTPETSLELAQRRKAIRDAVEALPEKLKSVVMLCEFSGLSTQEIAEALSVPPGTVGSRRSQAMARLETMLGPLSEGVAP